MYRIALVFAASLALLGADEIPGWIKAGSHPKDYDVGRDKAISLGGKPSGFIKSNKSDAEGFGSYMQMFDADEFRGKRVEFSAFVKSEDVADWAGLWMRIDGEKQAVAFDNMQGRPIKGTANWTRYSVVLDVAPDAKAVAFGILLSGKGSVWINDVRFEIVPNTVPVTDLQKTKPSGPRNLSFEQK